MSLLCSTLFSTLVCSSIGSNEETLNHGGHRRLSSVPRTGSTVESLEGHRSKTTFLLTFSFPTGKVSRFETARNRGGNLPELGATGSSRRAGFDHLPFSRDL